MGSKEFKIATVLGLLLTLSGCATVNYTYQGQPCKLIDEDEGRVALVCNKPKVERQPREIQHEPRSR